VSELRIGSRKVLAAGAAGVAVGTRFLAADESVAHSCYVERLIAASREDTVLTECVAAANATDHR
jgi:NAD(P)H-dependent flavin oxidoreductase YrpB (nitropropane dioxygenase family)